MFDKIPSLHPDPHFGIASGFQLGTLPLRPHIANLKEYSSCIQRCHCYLSLPYFRTRGKYAQVWGESNSAVLPSSPFPSHFTMLPHHLSMHVSHMYIAMRWSISSFFFVPEFYYSQEGTVTIKLAICFHIKPRDTT